MGDRHSKTRKRTAVILAAGQGTRMRSELPKVLHRVGGKPMVAMVAATARAAGCDRILVVVGHGGQTVREALAGSGVEFVDQLEQRGTGHALLQVRDVVEPENMLLVLSGDVPLVRATTLERLAADAESGWGAMAVAELEDPGSLGRVVMNPEGGLERIVEVADADSQEFAIREVNAGLYALPSPDIFEYLDRLKPDNAKGELYLTDALGAAAADGLTISVVDLDDPAEALGVNSRADLAVAQRRLWQRRARDLMDAGVTLLDPDSFRADADVEVDGDTIIHPGVTVLGATRIGRGCEIATGAWLRDATIGSGVRIEPYSVIDGARIDDGCKVGPFARLRPGTVLEAGAKIGNFVEVKNSRLGPGVKAGHLAYLGDATVGEGANIGAGAITCNYDGEQKHPTRIGRRAFIGSDTMLVAPVEVGDGATTGAGSTITQDVPAEALAVERSRQRNIAEWSKRKKNSKNDVADGETATGDDRGGT